MTGKADWIWMVAGAVFLAVAFTPWLWIRLLRLINEAVAWCQGRKWTVKFGCSWLHSRTVFIGYHSYPWVPIDGNLVKLRSFGLFFWTVAIASSKPLLKESPKGSTVS